MWTVENLEQFRTIHKNHGFIKPIDQKLLYSKSKIKCVN